MVEPRYDPATKKFTFPKGGEATAAAPTEFAYMAIPKAMVAKLARFAEADGATVMGTTDKGKDIARSKLARIYVLQAIQDLVDARSKGK